MIILKASTDLKHSLQMQLLELPLQSGGQARVHGGAPRQHDVLVQLGPDVDVAALDGVEQQLGNALALHIDEVGLEKSLWGLKPLPTNLSNNQISAVTSESANFFFFFFEGLYFQENFIWKT